MAYSTARIFLVSGQFSMAASCSALLSDGHALALIHVEADAPHCLHHATAGGEVDAEVTDVVLMHDLPPGIGAEAAAEAVAQHIEAQNGQQDAHARIDRQ